MGIHIGKVTAREWCDDCGDDGREITFKIVGKLQTEKESAYIRRRLKRKCHGCLMNMKKQKSPPQGGFLF